MKKFKLWARHKKKVLKVLAAVGAASVVTALFVKRDKVKKAVGKLKNKVRKAS